MRPQSKALLERLIAFGVDATAAAHGLRGRVADGHFAGQLSRSATAVAANYAEACEAESRHDFIHKMKICLKELRECDVWIRTVNGLAPSRELSALAAECNELIAIFVASVRTAKSSKRLIE
jgi:four helix bundle protein